MARARCGRTALLVLCVVLLGWGGVGTARAQADAALYGDANETAGALPDEGGSNDARVTLTQRFQQALQNARARFPNRGGDAAAGNDTEANATAKADGTIVPAATAGALGALAGSDVAQRVVRASLATAAAVGVNNIAKKRAEAKAAEAEQQRQSSWTPASSYPSTQQQSSWTPASSSPSTYQQYRSPPPQVSNSGATSQTVTPSPSGSSYYYYYTPPASNGARSSVQTVVSTPTYIPPASSASAPGSTDPADAEGIAAWAAERWQRLQGVVANGGANSGDTDSTSSDNAKRAEAAANGMDSMEVYTQALAFASQVCPPPGDPAHTACMEETMDSYMEPTSGDVQAKSALTSNPPSFGDYADDVSADFASAPAGGRTALLTGEPCQLPFVDDAGRTHNDCMDLGEELKACKLADGSWAACAPLAGESVDLSSLSSSANTFGLFALGAWALALAAHV